MSVEMVPNIDMETRLRGMSARDWLERVTAYAEQSAQTVPQVLRWISGRTTLYAAAQLLGVRADKASMHELGRLLEFHGFAPPILGHEVESLASWVDQERDVTAAEPQVTAPVQERRDRVRELARTHTPQQIAQELHVSLSAVRIDLMKLGVSAVDGRTVPKPTPAAASKTQNRASEDVHEPPDTPAAVEDGTPERAPDDPGYITLRVRMPLCDPAADDDVAPGDLDTLIRVASKCIQRAAMWVQADLRDYLDEDDVRARVVSYLERRLSSN